MNFTLEAQSRSDLGKGASRRLRHANSIPAVIYGGGEDPQSLSFNHDDIIKSLEHEAVYTSILNINIDGKGTKAVIKDIQRHAYKPKVLHMDLQRVSATEKLHMHVPIHFTGEDVAPGVKGGGQLIHNMNDIEVACLAKDLPEFIELDVSQLDIGGSLHISDLPLPEGVTSIELSHGEGHDQPVVSIQKSRGASDSDDEDESATEDGGTE